MGDGPGVSGDGPWTRLDGFLRADPGDPGCTRCRLDLDVYAELTIAVGAPATLLPGVATHLESCADCQDDLTGLIAAIRGTAG